MESKQSYLKLAKGIRSWENSSDSEKSPPAQDENTSSVAGELLSLSDGSGLSEFLVHPTPNNARLQEIGTSLSNIAQSSKLVREGLKQLDIKVDALVREQETTSKICVALSLAGQAMKKSLDETHRVLLSMAVDCLGSEPPLTEEEMEVYNRQFEYTMDLLERANPDLSTAYSLNQEPTGSRSSPVLSGSMVTSPKRSSSSMTTVAKSHTPPS